MGNGKALKKLLEENGMSTRQLSKKSGIAYTTLNSMIHRNSIIRYDFAVKIANALNVPVRKICNEIPENTNRGAYIFSDKTLEIIEHCSPNEINELEELIECFFNLSNDIRNEVLESIRSKSVIHDIPKKMDIEQKRKEAHSLGDSTYMSVRDRMELKEQKTTN